MMNCNNKVPQTMTRALPIVVANEKNRPTSTMAVTRLICKKEGGQSGGISAASGNGLAEDGLWLVEEEEEDEVDARLVEEDCVEVDEAAAVEERRTALTTGGTGRRKAALFLTQNSACPPILLRLAPVPFLALLPPCLPVDFNRW